MFGIGGFELFIILLFGFLIFGPDKLPEMAKTLGAALKKFNQAKEEMESVIQGEVLDLNGKQDKKTNSAKSTSSTAVKMKPAPTNTQESFAERKARYDKERAERKEREALEANRRAMKEEASAKANAVSDSKRNDISSPKSDPSTSAKPASRSAANSSAKPVLTPEELFGTKPMQRDLESRSATFERGE